MGTTLKVTSCRVFLNKEQDEHLKGFASIILNDVFAVCDLKIIQGNKGLFVAMPSRRRRDGTFHDVAHPICQTLRDHIEQVVLVEFNLMMPAHSESTEQTLRLEPTNLLSNNQATNAPFQAELSMG
jgi:stage V sporulation protein G